MRFRRPRVFLALAATLILLALVGLWGYGLARRGLAVARLVQSRLSWAEQLAAGSGSSLPSQTDIEALERDLTTLDVELRGLRRDLGPLLALARGLGWLPDGAEL